MLAERILAAARAEFSSSGYQGTSVRAIARQAGVDPALVYHYYRSKDELLHACLQAPPAMLERIVAAWSSPRGETGEALVRVTMANWSDPEASALLRTVLLTAAHHPETLERLRDLITRQLMGPARLSDDGAESRARASFIASQLLGLGLTRYVWRIEPIASMPDDEVVAAIGPTIQRYVDGDLAFA
ncbi:TetR family transcriptional regulator [Microbacterium sp. 18062]|uniref:TetR/AcrR family transcriptional regulator n=1 Tax=Microbacterium sp. 18062 TaxID=2681410 RepID=UPI00190F3588|nr:TetR family transcriptional regulator [Microbacterium sp. 18062]